MRACATRHRNCWQAIPEGVNEIMNTGYGKLVAGRMPGSAGRQGQSGSVILEAMIAILIFSIGILGLVGMQTAAVSNVSDAKYRSEANFLANQIIGQMWASQVAVSIGGLSMNAIDPTYNINCPPGAAAATAAGGVNTVVQGWAGPAGVQGILPNASAVVCVDAAPAANQQHAQVTISWKPPKAPAADPPHVHTVNAYIF
jgi:type IV pilus assembly protein PilV